MNNPIEALKKLIDDAEKIVFFGGAGVSTESGIPDFRSVDGLYNQKYKYPPETILSHSFFFGHTEYFYNFYRDKILYTDAEPNNCHKALTELERQGKLLAVVTQNIDGLHQKAGSKRVLELHGSALRNYCTQCGEAYSVDYIKNGTGIPRCEKCGGIIKPDVVLYDEPLDDDIYDGAEKAISNADLLIVGGTSLVVYPAAGLLYYYHGKNTVMINKSATESDGRASLILRESIGSVFGKLGII